MQIFQANYKDIEELSILFDKYRVFYGKSSDLKSAQIFLQKRFQNKESIIFLVRDNQELLGFIQLYPSFSSVSMKPILILNDLFVLESARQKGVAKLLLNTAKNHSEKTGAIRIILSTQISNNVAQNIYESLGYKKDEEFYHYSLSL